MNTNSNDINDQPTSTPEIKTFAAKIYRTRLDMKRDYDNSMLIYPFSAVWHLDYCRNIIKSHLKNSLVFSFPLSLVLAYALNPKARTKGMKGQPFFYYVSMYLLVYASLTSIFMLDAFIFCDYCKPWSDVYSAEGRSQKYKEILKGRIKSQQAHNDIKIRKTKYEGLKDDEI